MRLLAPAKINLLLRVGPPRDDGFHPLLTWMCTVGLCDVLTLERSGGTAVELRCATLDCGDRNLVVMAASKLRSAVPSEPGTGRGLRGGLEKHIPVGAGLGGGSSDGARALLGLNRLWDLGLGVEKLAVVAAELGSDVPFFLYGPSAVCTGRGEMVRPIERPRPQWAVLILPEVGLPTPAVYRRFDELHLGNSHAVHHPPDWRQLAALSATQLLPLLVNDLEPAAFSVACELGRLRDSAQAALSRVVRMSGSGSSLFTLFDDQDEAKAASEELCRKLGVRSIAVELCAALDDDLV